MFSFFVTIFNLTYKFVVGCFENIKMYYTFAFKRKTKVLNRNQCGHLGAYGFLFIVDFGKT